VLALHHTLSLPFTPGVVLARLSGCCGLLVLASDLQQLQRAFPSLCALVRAYDVLPTQLKELLKKVAQQCDFYSSVGLRGPRHSSYRHDGVTTELQQDGTDDGPKYVRRTSFEDDWSNGNFIPNSAHEFRQENFTLKSHAQRPSQFSAQDEEKVGECFKARNSHSELLPGVFDIMCPHAIHLGFFVMRKPESAETLCSVLFERLEKPKACVVYDNACNALYYGMRRNPELFGHTNFVVDAFHSYNHVSCPTSLSIQQFP